MSRKPFVTVAAAAALISSAAGISSAAAMSRGDARTIVVPTLNTSAAYLYAALGAGDVTGQVASTAMPYAPHVGPVPAMKYLTGVDWAAWRTSSGPEGEGCVEASPDAVHWFHYLVPTHASRTPLSSLIESTGRCEFATVVRMAPGGPTPTPTPTQTQTQTQTPTSSPTGPAPAPTLPQPSPTTPTPVPTTPAPIPGTLTGFFAPTFAGTPTHLFSKQVYSVMTDASSPAFLRVFYPKGSSAPSCTNCLAAGGAQAEVPIATGSRDDATLTYSVRFPVGFQWVKGGKLPGLCGGTCNSGGTDPNGTDGWSERLMWRASGQAEVYSYTATTRGYGDELGKGSWTWQADGRWHTVTEHVHLNTPGVADGYVDISYDGVPVSHNGGLLFRTVGTLHIDGLFFSTFYGGHDLTWAPTADMHADFANFRLA